MSISVHERFGCNEGVLLIEIVAFYLPFVNRRISVVGFEIFAGVHRGATERT
jgi:hypothetical protein